MKTDIGDVGSKNVKCIQLFQDRVQRWAFVNTQLTLGFHKMSEFLD